MICPIMSKVVTSIKTTDLYVPEVIPAECQKEKCAWWNSIRQECSQKSHGDAVDDWGKDIIM